MVQHQSPYFNFSLVIPFNLTVITVILTLVQNSLALPSQGLLKSWQGNYQPPADLSSPDRTREGGTRGPTNQDCLTNGQPLTALVPSSRFGATEASYPSFFVYIPAFSPPLSPLPAQFLLKDAEGNEVYQASFLTSGTPGIVMIGLPDQAGLPPLEVNKDYKWSFSISCHPDESSRLMEVEGWVRRVTLDKAMSDKLSQASPQRQVEIYAEAGIWHDALAILVELRRSNPLDSAIASEWQKLLNSAGLAHITKEALLPIPQGLRDESISYPSQDAIHTVIPTL